MKRNILLISPASDNEALWITGNEGPEVRNNMPPLGLATIAAATPEGFHVDMWDENVHGLIGDTTTFAKEHNLVGITGYKSHLPRCRQLAKIFRKRSIPVAVGGPGVSGTPDEYRDDFDILFIGEAERTWPHFLSEWEKGSYKQEYRQIEKIDLADSPLPKWDSIVTDMSKYAMGSVQTTRGCPFDCEFCDVIYLFGRRPRHKPIRNVLEEVKVLERLGARSIFFCDDEFIADRKYTKELLRYLIPLNRSFPSPLTFSTQLTMNVSRDDELLELLADANFYLVFVGIETPNKESLRETNKLHNIRSDLVQEIHKILSYGIAIRAGLIVGFDHDDRDIFDIQYDFIQRSFFPSVGINMLKAPFGTRLWKRLRQEGRVVVIPPAAREKLGHPRSYTNIVPKLVSRVELMKGYRYLLERVYSWESFTERILGFVSVVTRPSQSLKGQSCTGDAADLIDQLKAGTVVRKAIEEIISYTQQRAPYLMGRIRSLIFQHAGYLETIQRLLPQLDRQIELELLGELAFEPDSRPVTVSTGFKKAYKQIFPDIYRRVYLNLKDKDLVNAALVEVFVDFLVRFGESFSQLEEHHLSVLEEICDRTCAKFNEQPPEEFIPFVADDTPVPDVRRLRIDDDVLNSVEQELLMLVLRSHRHE